MSTPNTDPDFDVVLDVDVDLVIAFRATKQSSLSKRQIREDAHKAEQQYSRLTDTLTKGGLRAVGRRGESLGHLLVFVSCPIHLVHNLVKRERHSDFISGLPTTPLLHDISTVPLSPADRLRLVHAYITCMPSDGGLGVTPGSPNWDLVESIFPLHDRASNDRWIHTWTTRHLASVQLTSIREQFGDAVALYFAFLSSYTKALVFPALLGLLFYLLPIFSPASQSTYEYSPIYSLLLFLWALTFVEWWRAYELVLALRFGTRGAFRVEKHRAQYTPGLPWWKRELRVLASIPVILVFAGVLAMLLTGIFMLEAFVTQLYTGPGNKCIAFSPTLLFVLLVPRFLALYQLLAEKLTTWENHAHHSTHAASLTLKSFALSAVVAYLGLALSAFVYVPFGAEVMHVVQGWLFAETVRRTRNGEPSIQNVTTTGAGSGDKDNLTTTNTTPAITLWDTNESHAQQRLNPGRLRDQMFAYTVTNQAVGTFMEVGLPFVLRFVQSCREKYFPSNSSRRGGSLSKKGSGSGNGSSNSDHNGSNTSTPANPNMNSLTGLRKKRVVFEDEQEKGGMAERVFLERVREEAALPEYELFGDFSEMVTQFGYVVLWSAIWPLAGAMALLNNFLELRSDAYKMTVHYRRPVPQRTDTIGPWLDALTFLTWLGALTNAALVYLFHPRDGYGALDVYTSEAELGTGTAGVCEPAGAGGVGMCGVGGSLGKKRGELLMTALLVALAASHGAILMRAVVRYVVRRALMESEEVKGWEREEREVKERSLEGYGEQVGATDGREKGGNEEGGGGAPSSSFWDNDEGLEEIMRISKEV